jgi:hypothetical protein
MYVDWRCVYDDGERPYAPGIPEDQRRPLRIVTGDTVIVRVELVTTAGAPVVLGAGEYLAWMAKSLATPASRKLLAKQATAGATGSGRYVLTLTTAETRLLPVGRACHDLFAIRGDARSILVPMSELVIARSSLGGA